MMGSTESSPSTADGSVNGAPVKFSYKRDDGGEKHLAWTNGSSLETRLASEDIIGVVPVHAQIPDDYSILYVAPNDTVKDEPKASPVVFKAVIAARLPQHFLDDFLPPGNADWQIRRYKAKPASRLHVVVSTGSGTGKAASAWENAVQPMLHHVGFVESKDYDVYFTSSETTVSELTRGIFLPQANSGVKQSIILLSGDGGIVDIVNTLLSAQQSQSYMKPRISLLPLGTGNALAHSSRITRDNTIGLKALLHGTAKELPLFSASFSPGTRLLVNEGREERPLHAVDGTPTAYGAVVCSWGLHATLVADSDTTEYRKFGAERFKMAGKEVVFPSDGSPPHAYKAKVSVLRPSSNVESDWQVINRDTHGYILTALVSQLEKGFTINPASEPLDGKLRIVHFGPLSGTETMEIMAQAYNGGKHIADERVGYEEIEGLRIQFDEEDARWRRVCIDGKIIRVEKGGWVDVRSGAQSVLDLIVDER